MLTKQNESTPKILIVENPFSNKDVNILPLLQFSFNQLTGFNSGESSVFQIIDDTIRAITCHIDYDVSSEKYQHIVYQLYGLRDALGASVEIPKN